MPLWDFAWVADPSAWAGLGTLILLEIVLGIDNLVFISILASTLPKSERRHAFLVGLGLALLTRLVLLSVMAWVVSLTQPVVHLFGHGFSWRDFILMGGGTFLLFKGTMEMHDRLEGSPIDTQKNTTKAAFWQVIAQIVILDAIFSMDSVITSVGMVKHLPIMFLAVIAAVGFMLMASGSLVAFVERHPTIIILCLGFLLMIGVSLILDGMGFDIPKGYLYTAIIFSLLIEFCNQYALRNRRRRVSMRNMREATARVILSMLGGGSPDSAPMEAVALASSGATAFAPEEREMVGRVIRLSGRTARFIMTPSQRASWLDVNADLPEAQRFASRTGLSWLPVRDPATDDALGVVPVSSLARVSGQGAFCLKDLVQPAPTVIEHTSLADLLDEFRAHPVPLSFVVDEYGSVVGLLSPADLLSVLAGQLGDLPSDPDSCRRPDGSWVLPGRLAVDAVSSWLGIIPPAHSTSATLAGLILERLGHIPKIGETFRVQGWKVQILRMDGHRIDQVRMVRLKPKKNG